MSAASCRARRPALHEARCPRCASPLHFRKPDSVSRTWALLIAAMILYVPANLLPMMKTSSLFGSQSDTIMSGVVYFWTSRLLVPRADHFLRQRHGAAAEDARA